MASSECKPECASCGQIITGEYVKVCGTKVHPDCEQEFIEYMEGIGAD